LYPGERNEQSHQLISREGFELAEPYSFKVSLGDGLANVEELFAIGDDFGLELTD
jgi:hypothetical protein